MAGTIVGELLVDLRLRTAGLEAGLKSAQSSLEQRAGRMSGVTKRQTAEVEGAARQGSGAVVATW